VDKKRRKIYITIAQELPYGSLEIFQYFIGQWVFYRSIDVYRLITYRMKTNNLTLRYGYRWTNREFSQVTGEKSCLQSCGGKIYRGYKFRFRGKFIESEYPNLINLKKRY
jgi:hypothetical protein